MTSLWSALFLIASLPGVTMMPDETIPAWVKQEWTVTMGHLHPSPEAISITATHHQHSPSVQNIEAFAEPGRIHIELVGEGWSDPSEKGKRSLQQNLAHEMAHIVQFKHGDTTHEPLWWHEGSAELMSLNSLRDSGLWTAREGLVWRYTAEAKCAQLLNKSILSEALQAKEKDAIYACGFVVFHALTEQTGMDALTLRGAFHKRGEKCTLEWIEEVAGSDMRRTVDAFFNRSYVPAQGSWAIRQLQAGRL